MGIHRPEWLGGGRSCVTLNEGVIVSDDGARILSVNSRFEGMIGIPRAEIVGKEAYHFYSPEEADVIAKQKERGMRQGHNRFEFVLHRRPPLDQQILPPVLPSIHDDARLGFPALPAATLPSTNRGASPRRGIRK